MSAKTKQKKVRKRLEVLISEYETMLQKMNGQPLNHGTEARSTHPADGNAELLMITVPTARCIREQLLQARHALAREQAGLYGICEVCDAEIPTARLDILPSATTCVQCASQTR